MCTGYYKKRMLTFHDFYELIPTRLAEFKKIFDLESGKYENFPYSLYNKIV